MHLGWGLLSVRCFIMQQIALKPSKPVRSVLPPLCTVCRILQVTRLNFFKKHYGAWGAPVLCWTLCSELLHCPEHMISGGSPSRTELTPAASGQCKLLCRMPRLMRCDKARACPATEPGGSLYPGAASILKNWGMMDLRTVLLGTVGRKGAGNFYKWLWFLLLLQLNEQLCSNVFCWNASKILAMILTSTRFQHVLMSGKMLGRGL